MLPVPPGQFPSDLFTKSLLKTMEHAPGASWTVYLRLMPPGQFSLWCFINLNRTAIEMEPEASSVVSYIVPYLSQYSTYWKMEPAASSPEGSFPQAPP